jgi:fatty-acyl-CoA synthase
VPKQVHVVDALPRNAMGKILKRQLREELASRGDDYQPPQSLNTREA